MTDETTETPERWGMWLHGMAGLQIEEWLHTFDIEAFDGRGDATSTPDPDRAYAFPSVAAVLDAWKQVSTLRPERLDGCPNRPLSVFTMSPRRLPPLPVCPECDGRGEILDAPDRVLDGRPYWVPCPNCRPTRPTA